jgi:hypothetical protein
VLEPIAASDNDLAYSDESSNLDATENACAGDAWPLLGFETVLEMVL